MNCKLSVLVPVYNLEKYVGECLESVLSQETDFDFEVIVVDDCSPDNSFAVIEQCYQRYPQILKPVRNEQNRGLAYNKKMLLSLCRGEYIAYLDGDDLALPGKLQVQVDYLDARPDCTMVYHESEVFDSESGKILWFYSRDYYNSAYIPQRATPEHLVKYGCFLQASSVMFRRHEHLEDSVDSDCKIILDHPWHILNAMYGKGTIDFIDQAYGRYRMHAESFGAQTKRSVQRRIQVLKDQLKACDDALKLGMDEQTVHQGKMHYKYATALYFLRAKEYELFNQYIEESTEDGWFFDNKHRLSFNSRLEPDRLRNELFGTD